MTVAKGPHSLIQIAMPAGTDPSEIMRFQLETGISDEQAIALAATKIGEMNVALEEQYGGMLFFTRSPWARYRQGDGERTMTPRDSEFGHNDPVRSDDVGHMLPRWDYEDSIAWDKKFQVRADPELIGFSLDTIVERWKNRVDFDIIKRALTTTENAIGSGYDVPWAIGTGTNVNYIPPQWRGYTFTSTHTHFEYVNASTGTYDDLIEAMMEELRHHGYADRLSLFISIDDVATVSALSAFRPLEEPDVIVVGGAQSGDPFAVQRGTIRGIPGEVIGNYHSRKWGTCEVRYHERIPQAYCWMFKSMGMNSPLNPLAVRIDPEGFGLAVEPELTATYNPRLKALRFVGCHGVGVNVRQSGVAGYFYAAASSYVSPTDATLGG